MFPYGFWTSSIWKEAARAGLKQISKMVGQGNLAGASSLATTPGVLKPSAAGSQIRHLGRGSEGLATMVAHPEHGVAVRKLYDPRGISSPEMIARKGEVGKAIGNNPDFATFRGSAQTPHGQGTMHFSEFVPPAKGTTGNDAWTPQNLATSQRAHKTLGGLGYEGHDIRPGNMVQDARTGQNKLIDYMPGRSGEMSSSPHSPEAIEVGPAGQHLFNEPSRMGSQTTGGMLGRMLGGKSARPATNVTNGLSLGKTRTPGGLGSAPTVAAGTPSNLGRTSPIKPFTPVPNQISQQTPTKPLTPTSNSSPTAVLKPQVPPPMTSVLPATAAVRKPHPASL